MIALHLSEIRRRLSRYLLAGAVSLCSLAGALPVAAVQAGQADLTPVVIDADQGVIEIRNIGNVAAEASQIFVLCTVIRPGSGSQPCAAGLDLPGYIPKWNTLPVDIPALQPAANYRLQLFGPATFPGRAGTYAVVITADPLHSIAEANESNNTARWQTDVSMEGSSPAKPAGEPDDQVPMASKGAGSLQVRVLMQGKPVGAAIRVTLPGRWNQLVLQNEMVEGDSDKHMTQTPFEVSLPAGKYDLYVHALVSPLLIYMQTNAVPIEIKAGEQLQTSVTIPSGRLQASSTLDGKNIAGMKVDISGNAFATDPSGFKQFSTYGSLQTPIDVSVPPGKYHIKVWYPEGRQSQSFDVEIEAGKTINSDVSFRQLRTGYLKLNVMMDGKAVPSQGDYLFDVYLLDAKTGDQITPLEGAYTGPLQLPVGTYDVKIHERVIGGSDIVLKAIEIREGKTLEKRAEIHQPGSLEIVSHWTDQPTDIIACAKYYNPLNPDRLGALMGGHSVSRGNCLSSDAHLAAWVSSPGHNDGNVAKIEAMTPGSLLTTDGTVTSSEASENLQLIKGQYTIMVWPVGHRELAQTLNRVDILPGGVTQRKLEFRWPEEH